MTHEFDYAVIGGGLSGLLIATALSQETESVVLLEGQEHVGGYNRAIPFPTGSIENGLRFLPGTDSAQMALSFLERILQIPVYQGLTDLPPITYEHGHLKTFLSFGDITPAFFEELVYFIHPSQCSLNVPPSAWIQGLLDRFRGQIMTRSFVTRFQMANNQVHSLTLNGSKTLSAKNFIFCGSVKQLQTLLPPEGLSARARQKLSKNTYWTALCLDLCHSNLVTESPALHILNGTTQDELGPSVGRFLNFVSKESESTMQASQWVTFIEDDLAEESESVSHALKKIKRQIKRAYPKALDDLITERILVAPQIGGHGELKLKANQNLPEADNLWIGSPTMHPQKNLVGALLQAQLVLSSLGCQVAEAEKLIDHPQGL